MPTHFLCCCIDEEGKEFEPTNAVITFWLTLKKNTGQTNLKPAFLLVRARLRRCILSSRIFFV